MFNFLENLFATFQHIEQRRKILGNINPWGKAICRESTNSNKLKRVQRRDIRRLNRALGRRDKDPIPTSIVHFNDIFFTTLRKHYSPSQFEYTLPSIPKPERQPPPPPLPKLSVPSLPASAPPKRKPKITSILSFKNIQAATKYIYNTPSGNLEICKPTLSLPKIDELFENNNKPNLTLSRIPVKPLKLSNLFE